MAGNPLQNPSPAGGDSRAYPEHTADGSPPPSPPADGSQITEIIAKSGRGGRPAPSYLTQQPRHPVTKQFVKRRRGQ
jgi:hypothetical protein